MAHAEEYAIEQRGRNHPPILEATVHDVTEVEEKDCAETGSLLTNVVDQESLSWCPHGRVRATAPCYLPPNYRLAVCLPDGAMLDVIVPYPGVKQGQDFEADQKTTEPIMGQWSDGILDCFSSSNNGFIAFAACLCPGMVYGSVMERLGLNWCGERSPSSKSTLSRIVFLWFMLIVTAILVLPTAGILGCGSMLVVGSFVCQVLVFYFMMLHIITRHAVREKYKIPGNMLVDCWYTWWCSCCSVLQMIRHMKRSGDNPRSSSQQIVADGELV